MQKHETHLPGVYILEPTVHEDERGSFTELYNEETFAELGITNRFGQDNRSVTRKGILRGLHFQLAYPQAKLVRVGKGIAFDVVVDLRAGTETFGKYLTVELSETNDRMLFIPRGCAHGFLALAPWTEFLYKVDNKYSGPLDQHGIRWDDPDLAIPWPLDHPQVNDKDDALPYLRDLVDRGALFLEPK